MYAQGITGKEPANAGSAFTTDARLYHRLRQAKRLIIVTHADPDTDSTCGSFLLMNKYGHGSGSPKVEFIFVNPGESLPHEDVAVLEMEGCVVAHIDTGGIFDGQNFRFDHHYKGCEAKSATDAVFQTFYDQTKSGKYVRDLVEFVNRVDSGNELDNMGDDDFEALNTLNEMMIESVGQKGRFVAHRKGPIWLNQVIHNRPTDTSDNTHMRHMQYLLECYAQKYKDLFALGQHFEHADNVHINVNGLQFSMLRPNTFTPSKLRYYLNRFHHDRIDVFVTEYRSIEAGGASQFGVTFLSKKKQFVGGITELHAQLVEKVGQENIFMHHDEWIIYIKGTADITLTGLFALASSVLKRSK